MSDSTSSQEMSDSGPVSVLDRDQFNVGDSEHPKFAKVIEYREEKHKVEGLVTRHYVVEGEYPNKGMVYDRIGQTDIMVESKRIPDGEGGFKETDMLILPKRKDDKDEDD